MPLFKLEEVVQDELRIEEKAATGLHLAVVEEGMLTGKRRG